MKGKKVRISFADLKKKNQTAVRKAAIKVSGAKGTVTYAKKKGSKKITVGKRTGTITVKNGKVTALKKGTAVITATLTSGDQVTCKVKVTTSPKLSRKSVTVKKGKTVTVKITGKARSVKNVYKNTAAAKVTSAKTASKIRVKGLKKGQTTIKIRVNGVWLKLKVNVKGK